MKHSVCVATHCIPVYLYFQFLHELYLLMQRRSDLFWVQLVLNKMIHVYMFL